MVHTICVTVNCGSFQGPGRILAAKASCTQVQYIYSIYNVEWDKTPNESSPSSEIYVLQQNIYLLPGLVALRP